MQLRPCDMTRFAHDCLAQLGFGPPCTGSTGTRGAASGPVGVGAAVAVGSDPDVADVVELTAGGSEAVWPAVVADDHRREQHRDHNGDRRC